MAAKDSTVPGEDKFGKFTITHKLHVCDCCGRTVIITIHYREKPRLPGDLDPTATVLHNPLRMWCGVDCGCYAKFHRQVTHIQEGMRR